METALRLTENGTNPKARQGEVVVVTIGPKDAETTLRAALATGADRAIRVDAGDEQVDGDLVARILKAVVEKEQPDLVLLGKQAVEEGKIITFEPMSPQDRRVVHLALAKFAGVVTKSDGEGEARRVQIIPVRR